MNRSTVIVIFPPNGLDSSHGTDIDNRYDCNLPTRGTYLFEYSENVAHKWYISAYFSNLPTHLICLSCVRCMKSAEMHGYKLKNTNNQLLKNKSLKKKTRNYSCGDVYFDCCIYIFGSATMHPIWMTAFSALRN